MKGAVVLIFANKQVETSNFLHKQYESLKSISYHLKIMAVTEFYILVDRIFLVHLMMPP